MAMESSFNLTVVMKDRIEAGPLIKSWLGRVLVTRVGERVPKRAVFDAYRAYCAQNSFEPTTSSSFGRFVCEIFPEARSWRSRSKQQGSMGEMFYLNIAFLEDSSQLAPSSSSSSAVTATAAAASSATSTTYTLSATTSTTTTKTKINARSRPTTSAQKKRTRNKPIARVASAEQSEPAIASATRPTLVTTTAAASATTTTSSSASSASSSPSSSRSCGSASSSPVPSTSSFSSPHSTTTSSGVSSPVSYASSSLSSSSSSYLYSLPYSTPTATYHSPPLHTHHHHQPSTLSDGAAVSPLLWSSSLLHSNPAQLSLPAPPPSADEERHQQQRRLVAWLEDENADVHYPQPAQLPLVMSTTTTATTTTTTTVTTSRHLEPYAYEELVRYRHRQQQQQQQQLHGSRPVNLWTADAELHTLEVLHSFVDVYHHHIWISCPINPGCFDFETLRHICMTDEGRRERSPVSLNIYVALSIGSTYAGDLQRGLEFWMIAREHLGYVFDTSSYDVACTLRLMARAAHVFSKTEKEGREKAAYYFALAKQIFTAVGSVQDENYIMADKCNALYHAEPPNPEEALGRMMNCSPQPAWRRTWRLTEYQFLQCKYGRVAEGLRDHLWHVFAQLRAALGMLAHSNPLATSKLEEVMKHVEAFEAGFTQELEGDHFTANRHVVAYQRTFILFMKACCTHRLGWASQALHHTSAFFTHLASFNPGALAVMLSEMWWIEPIASEVAGLLRFCLEHRRRDLLSLFFEDLLAPLRGTIVWADRIARLAEEMLARTALTLPASHFFPYSSFASPSSSSAVPPPVAVKTTSDERRKRAREGL